MPTIIGQNLPNIPWQDKPQGYNKVVWRYSENPIIPRDLLPNSNSIFNSAVVPLKGGLPVFSVATTLQDLCVFTQVFLMTVFIGI